MRGTPLVARVAVLLCETAVDTLYVYVFARYVDEFQYAKYELSSHAEPGRISDSAFCDVFTATELMRST